MIVDVKVSLAHDKWWEFCWALEKAIQVLSKDDKLLAAIRAVRSNTRHYSQSYQQRNLEGTKLMAEIHNLEGKKLPANEAERRKVILDNVEELLDDVNINEAEHMIIGIETFADDTIIMRTEHSVKSELANMILVILQFYLNSVVKRTKGD